VRHLARVQLELGHKVYVAMPWEAASEAHRQDWLPVEPTITGKVLLESLCWSPAYGRHVLGIAADLLHTHGLWQHPSWIALKWKARHHRPHVCSPRGMLETWAWNHKRWKKLPVWWGLEKRNLQSAALLHATSDMEAASFRARGLTAPIAIIPNGVIIPGTTARFSNRSKVALFLSRIHPKKGLRMLLEAWAWVRPRGWQLHIVGPDEDGHRAELERLVAALHLGEVVRFDGQLLGMEKERAFEEAQLFILPTHSENFGIAVAEALAHGLPVITTHGAPWGLLQQRNCGWWVPATRDGLAAALDDATRRTPEELRVMGQHGREVVEERFLWPVIVRDMLSVYLWLLGQGERPRCIVV